MDKYDPSKSPIPEEWNVQDEDELLNLIRTYHKRDGVSLPNLNLHAVIHVVVENQLALGVESVEKTLDRLLADGVERHEAIHAIGSVLVEHLWTVMQEPSVSDVSHDPYFKALEALDPSDWKP